MKKCLTAMVLGLLLCATGALAEQKLLITEVLDPGQVEGAARLEFAHSQIDFSAGAESGKVKSNVRESHYSLGVGLIERLEVNASIPYLLSEKEKEELDGGPSVSDERDGFGDLTLGAKYRVFDEEEKPFSLAVGLDIKFDTASQGEGGTGTTEISPYVAVSRKHGEYLIPYVSYRATIANHGESDEHALSLGVEAEMTESITLDAVVSGSYHTAGDEVKSYESYGLEVAAYFGIGENLYLIPSVGVERNTKVDGKGEASEVSFDAANTYRGGLTLYFLY